MRIVFVFLLLFIFLISAANPASPIIIVNYPEETEFIQSSDFFLVVSLMDSSGKPLSATDISTNAGLLFDNLPVKEGLDAQEGVLFWKPVTIKNQSGSHSAMLIYKDNRGNTIAQKSWTISLLSNDKKEDGAKSKTGQSGRVFANASQYGLSHDHTFELSGGGAYRGYFNKWHYSADLYQSSLESKRAQPRNIYQVSFGYGKYFDLKAGDVSPQMNPLVLYGQRVRGVELSTHLYTGRGINFLNLNASYGEVRRAVDPYRNTGLDTNWVYGTFRRSLWSARMGLGYGEAFQFGLFVMKGRDDTTSIRQAKDSIPVGTNFVQLKGESPKDNAVIGADISSMMFKNRLELFGVYALSLYTRDISTGPITKDDLKSIGDVPVDPSSLSSFIIFNTSSTPISPYTAGILNSSAYQGGARLRLPFTQLEENAEFRYEMVGVNYYSMGAPLLGTARQGFAFSDRLGFLNNRILFSFNAGVHKNNDGTSGHATSQTEFSFQTSVYNGPDWPGFTLGYNSNVAENKDTVYGFNNGVGMFTLSGTYRFNAPAGFKSQAQAFLAHTGISNKWNMVSFDANSSTLVHDTSLSLSTLMYSITLSTEFPSTPLSISATMLNNSGNRNFVRLSTWSLNSRYELIAEKLNLTAGAALQTTKLPLDDKSRNQLRLMYGGTYSFLARHSIQYDGSLLSGIGKPDVINKLFYEFRF